MHRSICWKELDLFGCTMLQTQSYNDDIIEQPYPKKRSSLGDKKNGRNWAQTHWEAWWCFYTNSVPWIGWTISNRCTLNIWYAPPYPMFNGGRTTWKKASPSSDLTTAFTNMAEAEATAFEPSPNTPQQTVSPRRVHSSPEKIADVRSKYIQQIKELHSLLQLEL